MKLIVQIPCFNEEATLARTIEAIPRRIDGVDRVEVLIVDDGSSDRTSAVARAHGADHLVRHVGNRGLAEAFRTGLDACLRLGADIIVNTDGDDQYDGRDIPALIRPILDGSAEVVIGDRRPGAVPHFSRVKQLLHGVGSAAVRRFSDTSVPDTVSGLRAISRDAAFQINIVSPFSYTIEMIIQAGERRLAVASIPVAARETKRPSRLARSTPRYVAHSLATMLRTYLMYRPLRALFYIGGLFALVGAIPILRFLYYYFSGHGAGKIQSLLLGGMFVVLGGLVLLFGVLADLIAVNRRLLEMTLEYVRRTSVGEPRPAAAGESKPPRAEASGDGG